MDAYQQDRPVLEPDLADPADARWLGVHRAGDRRRRAGRLRLPAPGRGRPPRRAQPLLRSAGSAHRRPARRRAGDGRRRRPGRPRDAGRRAARTARGRAGGGRRLPVRGAPGVGHGRRPARRQRRPSAHPAAGLRLRQRPSARRRRRGRRRPDGCASTPPVARRTLGREILAVATMPARSRPRERSGATSPRPG